MNLSNFFPVNYKISFFLQYLWTFISKYVILQKYLEVNYLISKLCYFNVYTGGQKYEL